MHELDTHTPAEPPVSPLTASTYEYDGAALRLQREEAGMRREEVAVALHMSVASIEGYERGSVKPPAGVIAHLANAIGCSPGAFFTRKPSATG